MKIQLSVVIVIVATIATSRAQNWNQFPKLMVRQKIGCILGEAKCDKIGLQIRGMLPEVLNNDCRRCNPKQAANAEKLKLFMKSSFPWEWARIERKYGNNPNNYG